MDYTATIIRNVEIPPTLPDMDTLSDLTGNITLKEVRPEEDGLRVEGDLLWRGYFKESGNDCLWEGAEFFSEHIPEEDFRQADFTLLTPKIVGLRGEALSESTFRMEFEIKWEIAEEPVLRSKEEKTAVPEMPPQKELITPKAATPAPIRTEVSRELEEDTPRQSVPEQKKSVSAERKPLPQQPPESAPEPAETPKGCPCPQFCLRYYRVDEADNLEKIAERFSASVAKLKEWNKLDFDEVQPGKMIRIP